MSDAQAVIRSRKLRTLRRRDGLIQFASDYTSQNGEDGILAAIFAAIVDRTPCEDGMRGRWSVGWKAPIQYILVAPERMEGFIDRG